MQLQPILASFENKNSSMAISPQEFPFTATSRGSDIPALFLSSGQEDSSTSTTELFVVFAVRDYYGYPFLS